MRAPFTALVSDGEALRDAPGEPKALRARLAEVFGLEPDEVLIAGGTLDALRALAMAARQEGAGLNLDDRFLTPQEQRWLSALAPQETAGPPWRLRDDRHGLGYDGLKVDGEIVLRDLGGIEGLAGAPVAVLVAAPDTLSRIAPFVTSLSVPVAKIAAQALDPSRMMVLMERVALVRAEQVRLAEALAQVPGINDVAAHGWLLECSCADDAVRAALDVSLRRHGIKAELTGSGLRLTVGELRDDDRLIAALTGGAVSKPERVAEVVRDTKETRIVARVDLDAAAPVRVSTGVGFFDHMLDQVASHGGFALSLSCEGDLHTDPHHTIEDSALALGAALRKALGTRAGIGRFGFSVPMDETLASVTLDLGGRPYSRFEGSFVMERIGEYPTQLTAHVFRSLADALGASIHVSVSGEDDHHKTEACYKALGRALRQAIRVEGGGVPSTKGVIA